MSSILNNPAALSALQSLQMTQQSLSTVQNQVSTGLKVATAADNSSYWSIAAQLNADSGVVSASNDALSQGQSVLATASSAINSVITTINSISDRADAGDRARRQHRQHQHLARLARQAADRRRDRRLVQWLERSERQRRVPQLRLRLQRQRDGRDHQHHLLHHPGALWFDHRVNRDVDDQPIEHLRLGDDGQLQTQFAADTADTTAVTAGTITATYGTDAIYEDTTNQALTVQSMALTAPRRRRLTRPSTPTAIRSPRVEPRLSLPPRPTR